MRCILFGLLAAFLAGPWAASPVVAQSTAPFGFSSDWSLEKVRTLAGAERVRAGLYSTPAAPRSHPAFREYVLVASRGSGLCKVIAVGERLPTGAFGVAIREAFTDLRRDVSGRYGPAVVTDTLDHAGGWSEDGDWVMALLTGHRTLRAEWPGASDWAEGEAKTIAPEPWPADLAAVVLEARAESPSAGYVTLTYEFDDFEICVAEIQAAGSDVF